MLKTAAAAPEAIQAAIISLIIVHHLKGWAAQVYMFNLEAMGRLFMAFCISEEKKDAE